MIDISILKRNCWLRICHYEAIQPRCPYTSCITCNNGSGKEINVVEIVLHGRFRANDVCRVVIIKVRIGRQG